MVSDEQHEPTEEENLEHWNMFRTVPAEYTQQVGRDSRAYTSWNATWAKREATKLWGPYGDRWGLRDMEITPIVGERGATEGFAIIAEFFSPLSTFIIINDWWYNATGHCLKSLHTNTIKKALSMLGWAADIYLDGNQPYEGECDDPREPKWSKKTPGSVTAQMIREIKASSTIEEIDEICEKAKSLGLDGVLMGQIFEAHQNRLIEIKTSQLIRDTTEVFGEAKYGQSEPDKPDPDRKAKPFPMSYGLQEPDEKDIIHPPKAEHEKGDPETGEDVDAEEE